MKKSELLHRQADEADNDFQFWNLKTQAEKEEKLERFVEKHLPTIQQSENVVSVEDREYMFMIEFKDGTKIDYYPKKDRVFIKKINTWKYNGLAWVLGKCHRL
jgi:hypothetical protein